ncbi:hypothetical protein K435DRAFT_760478 [Dendrothele bispora CBS 962.96]|uniref:Uncharacterized protein n=1 Tax=Dendrothele bispora (strain CBS 962.96) TaxID=1314807 RepID=A0A4S8LLQ2_DENBC|nr:hypothetical protein K435DRAFT_760478 [Dendrothele bispora CBS 962.96]
MYTMSILLILTWVYLFNFWTRTTVATVSPKDCLQNSTLIDLVDCLNDFTVGPSYYNASSYAAAQPNAEQLDAWTTTITSMLDFNNVDCSTVSLPKSLSFIYTLTPFLDHSSQTPYCVLSETNSFPDHNYLKGWGLFVVPALQSQITRSIHLSAPHPLADIDTPQQAAAIFSLSGARSLLVSGRIRSAFDEATDCVKPVNPNTTYFKTDPAHDVNEPFNVAARAIRSWQNTHGGCPTDNCAYIQIHGKAASTCLNDTAFISSGLGASPLSSMNWYQTHPQAPALRIKDSFHQVFSGYTNFKNFTAAIPPTDPTCSLTATENVFGRLVNGVEEMDVCTTAADASDSADGGKEDGGVTGDFVHIEQAIQARQSDVYELWGEVMRRSFDEVEA